MLASGEREAIAGGAPRCRLSRLQSGDSVCADELGVVHDLNNILTAIGGHARLALAQNPTGPVRDSLEEIQRACGRAVQLVRVILEPGRKEDERRLVALPTLVEEVLRLLRPMLPPGVVVRTFYAASVPPIPAVASQVHQVLMNVGVNAVHAMRDAGGELSVEVDRTTVDSTSSMSVRVQPGPYVRVAVTDTGAGISRADLDRIFDPFFTTKGSAGMGLGLAAAQEIMEAHHGAVTVGSVRGRGTTVRLFFPV